MSLGKRKFVASKETNEEWEKLLDKDKERHKERKNACTVHVRLKLQLVL